MCPICFQGEEDINHLFLSCLVSNFVWNKIYIWLDLEEVLEIESLTERLRVLNHKVTIKFCLYSNWLFSLAICWTIWSCRNAMGDSL